MIKEKKMPAIVTFILIISWVSALIIGFTILYKEEEKEEKRERYWKEL